MRIWIDITNTPQVHFLSAIAASLKKTDYRFIYSIRDFSETVNLMSKKNINDFQIIGKHHGKNRVLKTFGLLTRFSEVLFSGIKYDVSLSCGSDGAIWSSWLKGKKSVAFGDNDLAKQWTYSRFVNFVFFPDAIERSVLNRQGLPDRKLFLYPGYKEDIYLADYIPDQHFPDSLPFQNYVIVRPENTKANYVSPGAATITPALLKLLNNKGVNVLFLPRYKSDRTFGEGLKHVYTPELPVNGLDAVHFSNGVFTGAGTLAREAACLGVPSFSFFAGNDLLAVDKRLISENKMYFSRNPDDLFSSFLKSEKMPASTDRSKKVKAIVIQKLEDILHQF